MLAAFVALFGGVMAFAGASAAMAPVTPAAGVTIVYRAYQPSALTVQTGESVTWRNSGLGLHTVTADDGEYNSGKLSIGETFTVTYTKPGTFTYSCLVHPEMHGSVTVLAPGSPGLRPPVGVHVGHTGHRKKTLVQVTAARPEAPVQLQLSSGGGWRTIARGVLDSAGKATLSVAKRAQGRLRALVLSFDGTPPLESRAVRLGAGKRKR